MGKICNSSIRNIAIIAHVDHGKTTLVDQIFKQSGLFRKDQEVDERIMDSMDLERERGITIAAKNCAIKWGGIKINIIDTPGHADFGGEVERALSMADGALLLVDASEGPLPQTRFVLDKALKLGLSIIVVINKIDRQDARPLEVLDEIYSLLIDLGATEEQLDFPVVYAVGRDGTVVKNPDEKSENLNLLMDMIVETIPSPVSTQGKPFQMLVSDLSYSNYLGRLAVGRIVNGSAFSSEELVCIKDGGKLVPLKVSKLQVYDGLGLRETKAVEAGDIAVLSGIENVNIGDTICTRDAPEALPRILVDEPTVFMRFSRNTSPFAGKDGKYVQPSKIWARLVKESLLNVSIRVEEAEDKEGFIVKGRGEFQMAIIVETMRREGFELCVGRPKVIYRYKNGKKQEPVEDVIIDCENTYSGVVTEKILKRKGLLSGIEHTGNGRIRLTFSVPSRSLIGYRDEFLTDTRGTGTINSSFKGYENFRGEFPSRFTGSLVSDRSGTAVAYALSNLEARGKLFVKPGDAVYEGMIAGEHNRENDLNVNPCKPKKLSNMRAAGKDDAVTLTPIVPLTLERAIQFIRDDELVEVTPKIIRMRKTILQAQKRKLDGRRGLSVTG
ncbi:MAG: translational GTPase TypA [Spirochaetes bacterium]|nr:translational GTPase TypA [Spirochaetota bacterium]